MMGLSIIKKNSWIITLRFKYFFKQSNYAIILYKNDYSSSLFSSLKNFSESLFTDLFDKGKIFFFV